MKTLPEMSDLDDKLREILILEVYFKDESTGGKELATKTAIAQIKQAIAKELMGCLPEKITKCDIECRYGEHCQQVLTHNSAVDEVRARLTAFIGKEK